MSSNTLNQNEDISFFFQNRVEVAKEDHPENTESFQFDFDAPSYKNNHKTIPLDLLDGNNHTHEAFESARNNPTIESDYKSDYSIIKSPLNDEKGSQSSLKSKTRRNLNPKSIFATPVSSDKSSGKANSNIVKNYIPITSNAFAHSILVNEHPDIQDLIYKSVREQCEPEDFNALRSSVLDYIKQKIFGKKYHTNQEKTCESRQYKLRSKVQMSEVFHDSPRDNERTLLIKRIIRNMMAKFIDSEIYTNWVENEYAPKSIVNRQFLADAYNRQQIKNVYTCHKFRPAFK